MKFIHVRNGMYIKSSIKSTVVQPLNWQMCKRRIENCASVESTIVQASNRRLYKRRIDYCTSVESTVVQASNQRLNKRQIDGFFHYYKKSIKICRCSFNATLKIFYQTMLLSPLELNQRFRTYYWLGH